MIFSFIFIALAAICNACMDKLSWHFEKSIFNKLDPKFWNPNVSWQYVKFLPGTTYRPDAWHLLKTCMVICISLFGLFAYRDCTTLYSHTVLGQIIFTAGVFLIWNFSFNVFFNKILSKTSYI